MEEVKKIFCYNLALLPLKLVAFYFMVTTSSEKLKKQYCKTLSAIYCPRERIHSFLNLNIIICLKQYGNKQAFDN